MSFSYNNKEVKNIGFRISTRARTIKDVHILKYKENSSADPIVVWVKPFSFIYSYNDFLLKSIIIERVSSNVPNIKLGRIYSGAQIYYGDIIKISVQLKDKYKDSYEIDPFDPIITVNSNYKHHFTAHKIFSIVTDLDDDSSSDN